MPIARPRSLDEAFDALDGFPDAHLLAGGTDLMVEVNFGHRRPPSIVALRRVAELQGYDIGATEIVLRAGLTWTQVENELVEVLPGLAAAARTIGSPQMRNAATIGGNVATASPAGDSLPVLAAMDATVTLASRTGDRSMPLVDFITGVKRTAIQPGEVIRDVRVPRLTGPQQFLKVGTRNAMVISIVCCGVVVDPAGHTVRCALGSVSPRPLRATDAETFAAEAIDWDTMRAPDGSAEEFGRRAAAAASPISDQRGTAVYRRHATQVITTRALQRSLAA